MPIPNSIAAMAEDLREWRRDFHEHPEICYEEVRTSRVVAEKLREFGLDDVVEGLGKTGVVGVLHGKDGPGAGEENAILVRADMDALPMQELNDFPHASKIPDRMHACGHDGHTTMLLGAARRLAESRNFSGTVYFCFQPAEEGGAGARAMIEDGLFSRFPCRAVFGMHNWPGEAVGTFGTRVGPLLAATGEFHITLKGVGGHAAMPHKSRDPIVAGAHLVSMIQTIASRRVDPVDPIVVSVTQFHAGSAYNVIPDEVEICGTIRAYSKEVQGIAYEELERVCSQTAAAFDMTVEVDRRGSFYPPTVNDAGATAFALDVARELAGADNVRSDAPQTMGGEDFAFLAEEKPGCFILTGNGDSAPLHHARYDFNDDVAPWGVAYWEKLVETALPAR